MASQIEDKKLLVVHSNSGMSSVIDEIMFCDDVAGLKTNLGSVSGSGKPNLILQDCKVVSGNCLLICRTMPEGQIFHGVPVVVATTHSVKQVDSQPDGKQQNMNRMASMISNLISVFGFTYLVMNKPARAGS
ncbi:MAG: hypothetical protein JST50_01745 [Bacteroidetes bacterium]|jgi:hypothetical protein|nr:hypothetical protein [Bacteroidota bacterium]